MLSFSSWMTHTCLIAGGWYDWGAAGVAAASVAPENIAVTATAVAAAAARLARLPIRASTGISCGSGSVGEDSNFWWNLTPWPVVVSDLRDHHQGTIVIPLLTAVTPPADTTKPRVLSWSLSTPTPAPSATVTFLSRIAFSTTARLPMCALCRSTDRCTLARLPTRTPGESTDSLTCPPEMITPLQMTLLTARPGRSSWSGMNLAGGSDGPPVRIGHLSLKRSTPGSSQHRSMCASKYASSVPASRQY